MKCEERFAEIETAIDELKARPMIVVVDDDDREGEGDLMMADRYGHSGCNQFHGNARTRACLSGNDWHPT
jgi:3,4-dihydroxy-2-butanone 4-phosphate synthase